MARKKDTPNDPARRERIVSETMQLLQEGGIRAVTARAVAKRAGVPVGSVSYHFDSVTALLLEASRRMVRLRTEALDAWQHTVTADTLIPRLAEQIHEHLTSGRALTVIAYELYVLGLRDDDFRQLSHTVTDTLRLTVGRFCEPEEAARLAATADGLQLASLMRPVPPSIADVRTALRGSA